MTRRIVTFEDAFQAGWEEPCEHGIPDPVDCPKCRLTPEEITRLAVLHGPYLRASATAAEHDPAA